MAREHTYEVQKGNQVLPEFVGKKVSWMKATTVAEALSMGHFDSEEALVAAAEQQRDIAVREDIRDILSLREDGTKGTVEEASEAAKTLTIGKPRAGGGVSKVIKPETKAKRGAQGAGNKLFEKCFTDEKLRARMQKDGIIDEAEYADWLAVNHPPTPEQVTQA